MPVGELMTPDIRLAEPTDLGVLLEMMTALRAEDYAAGQPPPASEDLGPVVLDFLATPALGRIWVACDGAVAFGYLALTFCYSFEFGGRDAFVDELYVVPTRRNNGWGGHLLRVAEVAAPGLGVLAIHLEVSRGNDRAGHLYRSFGFVDHDRYLMTKLV
jgi:GNAT superfamily N-acetyltransferase